MRARAIAIVADLIAAYRSALRRPGLPDHIVTFYHQRIKALGHEVAQMQIAGDVGDRLARTWLKVVPGKHAPVV